MDLLSCKPENTTPADVAVKLYIAYERWLRGEAEKSESLSCLKSISVSKTPYILTSIIQSFQFMCTIILVKMYCLWPFY